MPYSQISLVAPDSADPDSVVNVEVSIENLCDYTIYVTPVVRIDGIVKEGSYETLVPGQIRTWDFDFTMPGQRVTITAESWCESLYFDWHLDGTVQEAVAPPGEVVPPAGTAFTLVAAGVFGLGAIVCLVALFGSPEGEARRWLKT